MSAQPIFAPRSGSAQPIFAPRSGWGWGISGAWRFQRGFGLGDALPERGGRLLYLVHLAILLWWLMDKSRSQRATQALVALCRRALPLAATAIRVPGMAGLLVLADALVREALLADPPEQQT